MGHTSTIGELRERSLHAGLKSWYALPRDRIEVPLEGYVIDLVRPPGTLIEIQTRGFAKLKRKLTRLVDSPLRAPGVPDRAAEVDRDHR